MTIRIYVVDNGGQWTHREWRVLKELGADTKQIPNDTPLEGLEVDGLVLSGGAPRVGLAETLGLTGEYLDKAEFPLLGICAGHQFMAKHFGGEVGPAARPEFGSADITVHAPDPLFKNVPETFKAWESHNDEVLRPPEAFSVLAGSPDCKVQAMKHTEREIWGIQFHPEVSHTEHGHKIFQNFMDICEESK